MDPSDHRISVHEDLSFFREAAPFTAGQTGLDATLYQKTLGPRHRFDHLVHEGGHSGKAAGGIDAGGASH